MKRMILLSAVALFGLNYSLQAVTVNEPDSTCIFAYANREDAGRSGLHFAWSADGEKWRSIGNGYAFLKSDYSRWGSEKRMLNPYLYRTPDALWHCVWMLNEQGDFAHAASTDLIDWGRQSYYTAAEADWQTFTGERLACQTVRVDGKLHSGVILKAPRSVSAALIHTQWVAACKQSLWTENAKDDAARFAGLQPVEASIKPDFSGGKKISDLLVGVFFEDINYAADGGLYAELVQNRDFEYDLSDREGRDANWRHLTAWELTDRKCSLVIDTVSPIHPNNKHYAVLHADGVAGLVNAGFDGIPVKAGEKYRFSLFARSPEAQKGAVSVRLLDKNGETVGEAKTKRIAAEWKRYELTLVADRTVADARLMIVPQINGRVDLDMISLFPHNTFKGRKNGLRADLAQAIADIHPRFVRFPGGCVAHGDGLENMYRWKNVIGALEARKPQRNLWGYHQTGGLGYYEYFQFCEDIGAEPLPVVPAGVPCQNSAHHGHPLGGQQGGIPMHEMDDYIQEVLDLVEWANGDAKTRWGKVRAEAGHPKPFNLKYLGIGNEDLISDVFEERFTMIFNAVKAKHPEITVIGTVGPSFEGTDYEEGWKIAAKLGVPMVDEHYYQSPGWFIHNQEYYDRYDRSKAKVYLGEYAAHLPGRPNNIETALAEALHIINLERNGDVVSMASYAPLLAKEGRTQWNPDLIYFNNTEVKPTVGYYVQQLCGQNSGDEYIPAQTCVGNNREDVQKRFACSFVRDTKSGDWIVKLVNLLPVEVKSDINLAGFNVTNLEAVKIVLHGNPDDETAKPEHSLLAVSSPLKVDLPAYSFVVVRIKAIDKDIKVLADKIDSAYLLAYFKDDTHSLYFATSEDGYMFTDVNDGKPVVAGDTIASQHGIRDPYIMRGNDGYFYVVMTDLHIYARQKGYRTTEWERPNELYDWGNNKGFVLMKSKDLIRWTHSKLDLYKKYPKLDVGCAWAPELIFDETKGKIMIYFTMRKGHGKTKLYYACMNKDFTDLETEPEILFSYPDTTKQILDADITRLPDGRFCMMYVAQDNPGGVKMAFSDRINGGYIYQPEQVDFEPRACEAPNVWKRIGEDKWVLMYDVFSISPHNFGFAETADFKHFTHLGHFDEGLMQRTNFSVQKHGAVIHLTKEEAERLKEYWKDNAQDR
jgi:alpha-L-arabinofuranosidase